jgi:Transcription factor WhiB
MLRRAPRRAPLRSALHSTITYLLLAQALRDLNEDGRDVPCHSPAVNPEWWFAEEERLLRKARALCASCPLQRQCFNHGLAQREFGVWGGFDHRQRAEMILGLSSNLKHSPEEAR